jgi:hypothetical protein
MLTKLRKRLFLAEILFDGINFREHYVEGSKRFKGQQNLVNGSDPGTLIRTQTYKTERWRGAKGNRAEHKGELLERQAG